MARITDDELAALKAKLGELEVVTVGGADDFVLKKPTEAQWDYFISRTTEKGAVGAALRTLALDCLAWPAAYVAREAFARAPAMAAKVAQACTRLAGGELEVEAKKA